MIRRRYKIRTPRKQNTCGRYGLLVNRWVYARRKFKPQQRLSFFS